MMQLNVSSMTFGAWYQVSGDLILGEKIREIRRKMRLTQAQLGGQEFSKSFISQVEKGQTRPSLRSLRIIAARLNQPLSVFLDDETQPPKVPSELHLALETAHTYHAQGRLDEALIQYKRAIAAAGADSFVKADVYYDLAQVCTRLGKPEQAIDFLLYGVDEANAAKAPRLHIMLLRSLAIAYISRRSFDQAKRILVQSLRVLRQMEFHDHCLQINIIEMLAEVRFSLSEYTEARELLIEAIELSKKEYYRFPTLCRLMGRVCTSMGRFEEAEYFTDKAIQIHTLMDNESEARLSQIDKAILMKRSGKNEAGKKLLRTIANDAEKSDDPVATALAFGHLARINLKSENYNESIALIERAIEKDPSSSGLSHWIQTVSDCASHVSIPYHLMEQLSSLINKETLHGRELADCYAALGELYLRTGDADLGGIHLRKAVSLLQQIPRSS